MIQGGHAMPPLNPDEKYKFKVLIQAINGKLTNNQASKLLHVSVRQVQRQKSAVKKNGIESVVHKLKGKLGNHSIEKSVRANVLSTIKQTYPDFKPSFAAEKLKDDHGLIINPETLRLWMIEEGVWKVHAQRKFQYHAWRQRRDYFGELQQFDGSYHLWFERRLQDELGRPVEVCLLAAIDDATGKITHAYFDFNEGVVPVFNFWMEYVLTLGKPLGIYLDKFSTYKINHKMAVDNSELLTQFQKAMKILGIEIISANSPQAKGRIERLFETLQDRLVKELRLNNISSITEGNLFLKEFIPKFNSRFSVAAARDGNVHRQLTQKEKRQLKSIFSIKSTRRVNSDFTIQFKNHFYQLEEIQPVTIRPKERVLVEEWLDKTIHFKFRGKYLKVFILPERPKKIFRQPAILTNHPLNWKPQPSHPWRQYKNKI